MDKMELFGQGTRGYTPVILASRDGGGDGGGGGSEVEKRK